MDQTIVLSPCRSRNRNVADWYNNEMKRNIVLLLLITLALGVLLGFIIDRYFIESVERPTVSSEVVSNNTPAQENIAVEGEEPSETLVASNTEEVAVDFCTELKNNIPSSANFVITTAIAGGAQVASGDEIAGCVYSVNGSYGGWAPFEGQVGSYTLSASDGTILDEGPLSVVDPNWLTLALAGEDIEYNTAMTFDPLSYTSGEIILRNENPSGEITLDETITIPVTF